MDLDKISVVILAAGLGTRLKNFRGGKTDKVLLEINGTPMIIKQIEQLIGWGLSANNVICVTNPDLNESIKQVVQKKFGAKVKYVIQPKPLGIAHAFSYSQDLISSEYVLLVLGDNFFEKNPFLNSRMNNEVISNIFTKRVQNPKDFGVIEVSANKIVSLEEKPENPSSDLAVVGLYLYKSEIFNRINMLEPSDRGEYEITDLNRSLISNGGIAYHEIEGWWIDAGTPDRIIDLEKRMP